MKKYISVLIILSVLLSLINVFANEPFFDENISNQDLGQYETSREQWNNSKQNEIIIKVRNEDAFNRINNTYNQIQLFSLSEPEEYNEIMIIDTLGLDTESVLADLQNDSDVVYAQPNYKIYTSSVDEKLWAVQNMGQIVNTSLGTEGIDLNLLEAWEITKGSEDVVIAVADTGVDINHESLTSNIWTNLAEIPNNGIDDDGNGFIDDINGWDFVNKDNTVYDNNISDEHGTHIAGTIAGNLGVAPDVKILPLKCFDDSYGYTSDIIEAIEYAEKMGVKIVNCSFASYEYNYALANIISNSNMLFVCAAGNFSQSTSELFTFPACYNFDNVISVSAINNKGQISATSTYGKYIDIAAPGTGIYSTLPNNLYGFMDGTSSAAAYVSGAASLLLSQDNELTPKQLKEALIGGATTEIISPEETIEPENLLNISSALQYNITPEAEQIEIISDDAILDTDPYEDYKKYPFGFNIVNGNAELTIDTDLIYDSVDIGVIEKTEDKEQEYIFSDEFDFSADTITIADIYSIESDCIYEFSVNFIVDDFVISYIGELEKVYSDELSETIIDAKVITYQEYNITEENSETTEPAMGLMAAGSQNEWESNNSFALANEIYDDFDNRGYISSSSDVDYFKIKFSSAGLVNFWLGNIPIGNDYDLEVYDWNYVRKGYSNKPTVSSINNNYESIPLLTVEANKYYYIKVLGYNGSYNASVQYLLRAKHYSFGDEYEANETLNTAKNVSSNGVVNATINHPEDSDWYKFNISGNNLVNISFSIPSSGEMFLMDVYRSNGTIISGQHILTLSGKEFSCDLTSGTYYVNVYAYNNSFSSNNYKLTINSGNVTNITLGGATTSSSVTAGNIQYFRFSNNSDFGAKIELTNIGTSKFNLYLYELVDNKVYILKNNAVNKMSHSLKSGTYLVGVTNISGGSSFYIGTKYSTVPYRCDTIESGLESEMKANNYYPVELSFINTGSQIWYNPIVAMGALEQANQFTSFLHNLLEGKTYEYGGQVDFAFNLRAPNVTVPTTYTTKWQMMNTFTPFDWAITKNVTVIPDLEPLSVNETKLIATTQEKLFKVTITSQTAGDYVFRTAERSSKVDTVLTLYNASMGYITENDNAYNGGSGVTRYSTIERYLSADDYFIKVTEKEGKNFNCILTLEKPSTTPISEGGTYNINNVYEEYFSFSVPETKTYVLSTNKNVSNCDTYLLLLNSDKSIKTTNDNSETAYARITTELIKDRIYYLRVTSHNYIVSGENYKTNCKLTVSSKAGVAPQQYTPTVNITSHVNNQLAKLENGSGILIEGLTQNTNYVDILVNDISIGSVTGSPFKIEFKPTTTGIYVIKAIGEATHGNNNPVSTVTINIVINDAPDELNFGNDITLGHEKVNGISYIGDIDCFKFVPLEDITYTIDIKGQMNLKTELYTKDENNNFVLISECGINQAIKEMCESGKTYYIKIFSPNNSLGSYTLKVTASYIDKYEPNNSFANAKAIELSEIYLPSHGSYIEGSISGEITATIPTRTDVDYYSINITQEMCTKALNNGYLSLTVSIDAPELYDLAVYNSNKQLFDVVVGEYSGNSKLISIPLEVSMYYVKAYPRMAEFSSKLPYTIMVQTRMLKQTGGEAFGWGIQKANHTATNLDVIKYKFEDNCKTDSFISGYSYADIVREAANNWNNLGIEGAPDVIFAESTEDYDFLVKLDNTPNAYPIASAGHEGLLIYTSNFNNNLLANTGTQMNISVHDMGVSTIMHELGHMLGLIDLYMYEISETDRNNYFIENGNKVNYLNSSGNKINNRHNLMCGKGPHQDITVNKNPNGTLRYVNENDILGVRKAQGWDSNISLFSLGGGSVTLFLNNTHEDDF